jgi:decaprenyl-phosphate phosphoribosyltransferase
LACVSSGFVLRAIAGAVAVGVALSPWFLIVTSFGSLFVVAGKRSAELSALADGSGEQRRALAGYPPALLRSVRILAVGVAAVAYCLWAFSRNHAMATGHRLFWAQVSVAPFVVALLLVELRFERGLGDAPEELALSDRTLQAVLLVWLAAFVVATYA